MTFALSNGPTLAPGAILANKYRIVRELGRGGVGVVVEAEHLRLRQRVAIKVLDPYFVREPEIVERFEREARAMASIKSPYVTSVSDVDILPDGTPYMVMELLSGADLAVDLRQRTRLPLGEALNIALQACEGLEVIHAAGIIHRDLKPSNLFVVPTERGPLVKVMDFGISKFEGNEVTRTNSSLGTPAYMSPEQVRSPRDVDVRTDLWSLGVILFRALSGTLPFEGEGITGMSVAIVNEEPKNLGALRPELPQEVIDVVHRLLDKDRRARFSDAQSLREALTVVATDTMARPPAPTIPYVEASDESKQILDSFVRNSSRALRAQGEAPAPESGGTAQYDPRFDGALPYGASPSAAPSPYGPPSGAPEGAAQEHASTSRLVPPPPPRRSRAGLIAVALGSAIVTLTAIVTFLLLRPRLDPPVNIPPASAPTVADPAATTPPAPTAPPAVSATSTAEATPPSTASAASGDSVDLDPKPTASVKAVSPPPAAVPSTAAPVGSATSKPVAKPATPAPHVNVRKPPPPTAPPAPSSTAMPLLL